MRLFWFLRLRLYSILINVVGFSGYLGPTVWIKGLRNIYFGRDCRIFPGARLESHGTGKLLIGDYFRCGHSLFMTCSDKNILIGSYAVFSANVFIGTQKNDFNMKRSEFDENWFKENVSEHEVVIGDRCFIGYGAVILPGTVLGDGCVVGANAVVSGSHPNNSTIAPSKSTRLSK
jgi:acetyltransferase-like isoleucine patch superfamily enzyme